MNMKEHILAALEEQFDRWEELLASMHEDQVVFDDGLPKVFSSTTGYLYEANHSQRRHPILFILVLQIFAYRKPYKELSSWR
jgi:hypothetical protein